MNASRPNYDPMISVEKMQQVLNASGDERKAIMRQLDAGEITLRDIFAAAALAGLAALDKACDLDEMARLSYIYADALLAERQKLAERHPGK